MKKWGNICPQLHSDFFLILPINEEIPGQSNILKISLSIFIVNPNYIALPLYTKMKMTY